MNFKQFVEQTNHETPGELVGLTVYYLMVFGGEETVDDSMANDILNRYDFTISRSAIAVKLKHLADDDLLQWFDREGAPSGYIMTPDGMSEFEQIIPFSDSNNATTETEDDDDSISSENVTQWDAFVSHASEDKEEFVEPLANHLEELGLSIWYDDFELSVGDSIPEEIEKGLAHSDYAIVVLSESFFQKNWPQEELDSLIQRDVSNPGKIILPVCYDITPQKVMSYNTLLGKRYLITGKSMDVSEVAEELHQEIMDNRGEPISSNDLGEFDHETLECIAEIISDTWEGDEVQKFFQRMDFGIDWNDAMEGHLQEYIATFPVEAKEKGLILEKKRKTTILKKLESLNNENPESIVQVIERLVHPRSHIRNDGRRERVVERLDEILRWEDLKIANQREVQFLNN